MAQALRARFPFKPPELTINHLVIGGGAVGLAIARKLAKFTDRTTFLIERHRQPGQETSSRNSEVIHAGIYYPLDSLKTKFCCRGRTLLYEYARQKQIPHKKVGKLVIATSSDQKKQLSELLDHASKLPSPVNLRPLSTKEALEMEPDLSPDIHGAVYSPETGIIDSHAYMAALENDITDANSGELVYDTKVVRIDKPQDGTEGYIVQSVSGDGEPNAVQAKVVVNSAGLNAHTMINHLLGQDQQRQQYFCKGSYFSYKGPGVSKVNRLLYPCPEKDISGLGTHLTMNLAGEIRFGPDVEWLSPPNDSQADTDYWESMLNPSEERLDQVFNAVRRYLPKVERDGFAVDYAGIRPKLSKQGEASRDFEISHFLPGFISLLGIESPGLTSSLAIAEAVEAIVRRDIHGLGVSRGKTVSSVGNVDAWG